MSYMNEAYKQLRKVMDMMYEKNLLEGKIIKEAIKLVIIFENIDAEKFADYSDCTILAADELRAMIDHLEVNLRVENYKSKKILEILEDMERLVIEEGIC